MAGIGSIAVMGTGIIKLKWIYKHHKKSNKIARFGKEYINNQYKAKITDIKNFGDKTLQAVQNMSELITRNKDDLKYLSLSS